MSKRRTRVLNDAEIKAIHERRARDERGEVPPPETLLDLVYLSEIGPDAHFIQKRLEAHRAELVEHPERAEDAYRAAHIELLRSDIPLSRFTRDMLSNELSRLWWPDEERDKLASRRLKAYVIGAEADVGIKIRAAEIKRQDDELAAAKSQRNNAARDALVKRQAAGTPVARAWDELAARWGHESGEALRKWLNRTGQKQPK